MAVLVQLIFTAGAGADPVGADGPLPRHPRHPGEPADAVVLRDADHLSVVPAERADVHSGSSTSTRSRTSPSRTRRSCSSTGSGRPLEVAARRLGGVLGACCSSPATGCSIDCATRSRRPCDHEPPRRGDTEEAIRGLRGYYADCEHAGRPRHLSVSQSLWGLLRAFFVCFVPSW